MRFGKKIALLTALFITIFMINSLAVSAQGPGVGLGVSPSVTNLGVIGRGGSATAQIKVYNLGNDSILYTATPQGNITNTVTVNNPSGTINGKSNATLQLTATVPGDASPGMVNGTLLVNATTGSSSTAKASVQLLPALEARVNYTVGNYSAPPPQAQPSNGTNWELIGSVIGLVVLAAVIVVAVYMLKRRS